MHEASDVLVNRVFPQLNHTHASLVLSSMNSNQSVNELRRTKLFRPTNALSVVASLGRPGSQVLPGSQ